MDRDKRRKRDKFSQFSYYEKQIVRKDIQRLIVRKCMRLSMQFGAKIFLCIKNGRTFTVYSSDKEKETNKFLFECLKEPNKIVLNNQDYKQLLLNEYKFIKKKIKKKNQKPSFCDVDDDIENLDSDNFCYEEESSSDHSMNRERNYPRYNQPKNNPKFVHPYPIDYHIKDKTHKNKSDIKSELNLLVDKVNKIIPNSEIPREVLNSVSKQSNGNYDKFNNEVFQEFHNKIKHDTKSYSGAIDKVKEERKEIDANHNKTNEIEINLNKTNEIVVNENKTNEINVKRKTKTKNNKVDNLKKMDKNSATMDKKSGQRKSERLNKNNKETAKSKMKKMRTKKDAGESLNKVIKKEEVEGRINKINKKSNNCILNNNNKNQKSLGNLSNEINDQIHESEQDNKHQNSPNKTQHLNNKRQRSDSIDKKMVNNAHVSPMIPNPHYFEYLYNQNLILMNYINMMRPVDDIPQEMFEQYHVPHELNQTTSKERRSFSLDQQAIKSQPYGDQLLNMRTPGNHLPFMNQYAIVSPLRNSESSSHMMQFLNMK